MKKVSIITVVWNAAKELDGTLQNLFSIDYENIEVIVIDGKSTDRTPEIIEKYRDKISYSISEPDNGLYDAMNKGIQAATGDYIWFINAGDKVYSTDVVKKMFQDEPDADIYYGETMVYSEDGRQLGLRKKKLPNQLTWKSLKRGMVVCHQSFIIKRSIAPKYDLKYRYVADVDWVINCLKSAKKAQNTGMILSSFPEGGISTRHRRASLRERWHVMVKHYGWLRTFWAHVGFILDTLLRQKYRKNRDIKLRY